MFFVCLWIVFKKKTNLCQAIGSYRFCFKKDPVFRCRHFQPARVDAQELRISFAHRSKLSPFDPSVAWLSTKKKYKVTLYGTTVSHHLWKTKIIFNIDFSGDMLVPRRVLVINGVMGKWPKIIGFHWVLFHLYKRNCIILTCNCFFFRAHPGKKAGDRFSRQKSEVLCTSENLSKYVVGTFLLVKTQLKGSWFVKSFVFNASFFQFSRTLSLTLYSNRCCIRTTYSYL